MKEKEDEELVREKEERDGCVQRDQWGWGDMLADMAWKESAEGKLWLAPPPVSGEDECTSYISKREGRLLYFWKQGQILAVGRNQENANGQKKRLRSVVL